MNGEEQAKTKSNFTFHIHVMRKIKQNSEENHDKWARKIEITKRTEM